MLLLLPRGRSNIPITAESWDIYLFPGPLEEAEADLIIAKRHASREYEIHDVIYNLAGVFALQRERGKLLEAVRQLSTKPRLLASIRAHLRDYFQAFSEDDEFLKLIGAV